MPSITLESAIQLTGLSRRTLWRRIATGTVRRLGRTGGRGPGHARIELELIRGDIPLPDLEDEDLQVIQQADAGDPAARHDVALMLMEAGCQELAIHWLTAAANQQYPDAMHWLGRCHITGEGVPRDEALGLSWIRRAAERGHFISRYQIEALVGSGTAR
ncbi:tetratricopeptide repeat protein [Ectothiorhodospira shaposhnikovii]|uniref:tetratricopeptide repeat protein n=1 Tax=Ectothiorhodospira shaposhnikovii TaxID=1054 RepID=UPI0039A3852E